MGDVRDDRQRHVWAIVDAARSRPEGERRAFLVSACAGDDALREEVDVLLADESSGRGFPQALSSVDDADVGSSHQPVLNLAHPSAQLGRYRIERLLGRGGMGSVFLAYDSMLRRRVALKVIDSATGGGDARMRLLREARSAAALNHPNICTIHEVDDSQRTPFIAMEYVEGRSLREHLNDGAMLLADVVRYAIQAADALAYAHAHGVIHRDFKAANAIVTEGGRLKIVDFGLARRSDGMAADATTMESLVQTGTAVGTPYAMAPEQVRGEATDPRTDVWALGVLLYEMISGGQPFFAATIPDLFSSILRDAPRPLPSTVPAAMAIVIARCLEKDPARRYATGADVGRALAAIDTTPVDSTLGSGWFFGRRRVLMFAAAGTVTAVGVAIALLATDENSPVGQMLRQSGMAPTTARDGEARSPAADRPITPRRSVGLLGFDNVSARPEVAYISTALDQGLGSDLAIGDDLRIVSGEEISRMKQELLVRAGEVLAGDTLRRVRSSVGVDVVVTGAYLAPGPQGGPVRVDIRVQDTESGRLLGSVSSTGAETDLLRLIAESGAAVRRALGLTGADAQQATSAALPASLDARRLYAEGLNALRAFDAKTARDLFERSIAQEPNFALAHVGLANAWSILGYDSQAQREAATATGLAQALRKEEQSWIEGLYREYAREWGSAIGIYRALASSYPDEVEYALKLADAQTSAGAPKDALTTLVTLRRTVRAAQDDPRVRLSEAIAAEALGDTVRLEGASRAAIAGAERRGARLLIARASISLARAFQLRGDVAAATEANQTARRLFEEAGDRRGVARALIQLGTLSRERGDLGDSERTLRTALQISRDIGNKRQTSQALNELANVLFDLRRFEPAAGFYEESVSLSRELGDQGAEARALGNLASVRYEQGDVLQAQRLDEQALTIKRALGDQRAIAFSLINISETSTHLGKLDAAQRGYEESRAINEKLGAQVLLSYSLSGLSGVALQRDQLPLAQGLIERAIQVRREARDVEGALELEVTLARVLLERGNFAAVSELLGRIQERLANGPPEQAVRAAVVRAEMLVQQRQAREAQSVLSAALRRPTAGYSAATGVAVALAEARVQSAMGQTSASVSKARAVAADARMRGLLAFELDAELALANMTVASGRSASLLAQRARAAGFALVARKAEALRAGNSARS